MHALHTPFPQTMFVPQLVPFVTLPLSTQTGSPVSQLIAAVLHGPDAGHVCPGMHCSKS